MNIIEFTLFYCNYVGTNKVDPTIIEHYYNLCKDSGMCYADFLHSIRLQKTDLTFTTKEDLNSNLGIVLEHDVLYFQIDMYTEAILYIELTGTGFLAFNGEKDVRCNTIDEAVQILNIFHLTNS